MKYEKQILLWKGNMNYNDSASIEEIHDFCSKVRQAGGTEILPELLPGVPGDAKECLIAKNLNFDCEVKPLTFVRENGQLSSTAIEQGYEKQDDYIWGIIIEDETVRGKISRQLGLPVLRNGWGTKVYGIVLPARIARAASGFDHAMNIVKNYRQKCKAELRTDGVDKFTEFIENKAYLNG